MLEIIYRPVGDLVPYANNPRTHSDEQIAQLVASIQEFGFTNPILIDENLGIIAGHGRHEAAPLANLDEVPTIMLSDLTDEQRRAYVIADNKLTENGDWDAAALEREVRALGGQKFDLDLLGFNAAEMRKILEEKSDTDDGDGKGNPVIQYNIVFDNAEQQDNWYLFLSKLREMFGGETIAERLGDHIEKFLADNE